MEKMLLHSTIPYSMILLGIIVVYTFYNKNYKALNSTIITGANLGLLVTTHSMM